MERTTSHGGAASALLILASIGCAPSPLPMVHLDRATRTDAFLEGCRAGQAPACVVAGLRFLREVPQEPALRIGARKLFERGCELGRGDACHAAGLLASPIDAALLHRRACELGFRAGCERNDELLGRAARTCEPALVDPEQALVPVPPGLTLPEPLPGAPFFYPVEARAAAFEGSVRLCVRVSARGQVTESVVLRDAALLSEAARAMASLWRFPPVLLRGVAHGFVAPRMVHFRLE